MKRPQGPTSQGRAPQGQKPQGLTLQRLAFFVFFLWVVFLGCLCARKAPEESRPQQIEGGKQQNERGKQQVEGEKSSLEPKMSLEPKVLYICNWADYLPFSVIKKFEAETGIKVHYDVFDSSEMLEAKLLAARSGYDVVFPSAWPDLARWIPAGVYLPLDFSQIPNSTGLDAVLMAKLKGADPQNQYAVPYLWGTTGFAYNDFVVDQIFPGAPVDSLRMLFDPEVLQKLSACRVTLLDSSTEVFSAAFLYLGLDPTSEREEDLEKAEALLLKIRPFISKFDSFQFVGQLVSGESGVSQTWSSYGNMARKRSLEGKKKQEVRYVIPKEGSLIWIDLMAIPKDAPHPKNAHAFINFILQPEVMAEITNYTCTANAVPGSKAFIQKVILEDPGVYPSPETFQKLIVDGVRTPKYERERVRIWTKIKTGH